MLVRTGLASWIVGGRSCRVPVIAGFLDAVGVVPGSFNDAGVAAVAAGVEVVSAGDVGDHPVEGALALVRGKKPGRRPGGG